MGNFLRRSLAFILGMVFGFVVLATGIVIAGYYAYKNLSLSSVGVNEEVVDLGDLNNATFEELVALVTSASKDPSSYTFADLEEDYGLDVDGFLTSMGLDVNSIHPDDVKAFKQLSPFSLAVEGGADKFLQNINLGVVFGFIPKDESGVYPIFSEGARSKLRAYTIGDLMKFDEETGESKVLEVLGAIKFGGILSSSFNESYDATTAEYNYTAIESGFLDSLGNLSFSAISGITSGEELDIGFELNEGIFKDLGSTTIGELMGLEGGEGDALAIAFGDKKLGDIFVKNGDVYEFDIMNLLNSVKVGALMGMHECNGEGDCSVGHSDHVNGWYDGGGNYIDDSDIGGELMTNLYSLTIENLTNGSFDIVSLTDGIYLGKALGYSIGVNGDYCGEGCDIDQTNPDHKHEYYWVDGSGDYAGALNNSISNISINDVMNGELSIDSLFDDVYLGELMGNTYCNGTSCSLSHGSHVEGWYDGSQTLIDGNDIAGELMINLYGLKVSELMDGSFDIVSLTDGIFLGKAFGYTYCDGTSCSLSHDNHVEGWYDESGYVGAMNNSLANIKIADVMNGSLVIEDVIGGVYLGELMGNTYCDGTSCNLSHSHVEGWYDGSNNLITATDTANEIMLKLYDITVTELMNNGVDMASLTSGIYLGKAMGYTYCDGNSCSLSHDNHVKGWYNESGYVGAMNNSLADIEISSVMNGGLNINDVIGGLKLGEVMGNVYCDGNSCSLSHGSHAIGWYKKDGSFINPNDIEATDKIVYNLYLTSLSDIMNGSFDIESAISDMYVGELMGYDGTVNAWTNGGVNVSSLENVIANIKMSEMLNGDLDLQEKIKDVKLGDVMSNTSSSSVLKLLEGTSINDLPTAIDALKIGQIMGYTQYTHCSAGSSCSENHSHWYNGTKLVTGIYGALSSYSIKSITEGNIANLKIGDVIEVGDNKVLQLLAGSSLTSVATDANAIQIGKVMGYELKADDGKWYTDTNYTTPIDGLEGKIASYTIEEISNGALSNLINNLTIGDVLTDTSAGAFGLIYQGALTEGGASYEGNTGAIPVTELSERMLKGFKEASYSALEGAGVISLTDEEKEKITYFYANIFTGEKPTDWKTEKTLPEVIKDIISIIKIL